MNSSIIRNSILKQVLLPFVIMTLGAYILIWAGVFRLAVFPYPHDVLMSGIDSFNSDKEPVLAIITTLRRLLISFSISLFAGLLLALLLNSIKFLEEIFALPIDIIRSIPVITLFPLFITLFGFTEATYLAVPTLLTSVIMYVYLAFGLKSVSQVKINYMKKWGASRLEQLRHLYLPSIAPHLFTSIRVCVSLQLILVLVAEMFLGASDGIGTLIYDYQEILRYEEMYFFIILAGLLGWAINKGLEILEKRVIYWRF